MKKIKFKNYLIAILFFSLPIMLSSQYYIDDMGRAAKGYTRWGIDGRPVSDWLMQLLSFNHRLIDIFPLPLILSCLLMALTLYMFHKKYIVSGGVISSSLWVTYYRHLCQRCYLTDLMCYQ
ncbi:glucosyltransferase domain-containing protein [Escherichia coli]|uniref:glucosyltransferase domain-containing protein n=1 Tax=Escherichia coli TaxID=562 RepID=UPI000907912E|nr:hypothetical protein [Escherichia coli]EFO1273352.1 hypothetical protein [Escherichia coli]HAL5992556.1 hypothetical protein [Escherichia coli]HBA2754198.1 hypothetical protein [Escherichia coli]